MNSYIDLPDAPWISMIEKFGYEEPEEVDPDTVTIYCPVCGAENPDTVYLDDRDEVCGCEFCLRPAIAWDVLKKKYMPA